MTTYWKLKETNHLFIETQTVDDIITIEDGLGNTGTIQIGDINFEICGNEAEIITFLKKIKKLQLEQNAKIYLEASPAVKINELPVISLVSLIKTIDNTNDIEYADDQPNSFYLSDNNWLVFQNIPTNAILESKKNLFKAKLQASQKVALIKNDIENCQTIAELENIDISTNAIDIDLIVDGKLLVEIQAPNLVILQNITNGVAIEQTDLQTLGLWLQKEPA